MGSISISLTDSPWQETRSIVLHITGVALGRSNGDMLQLDLPDGANSVDMMQLQNGMFDVLIARASVPAGQYDWMRLHIDPDQSYIDLAGTGGRHRMEMGSSAANGLEVHERFQIQESVHEEFMLDFDVRNSIRHHHHGMMGDEYELLSAMRLINMHDAGGLTGMIAAAMVDVNHADCDPAPGGNWAYLFPDDAAAPDDIADPDSDGVPGPIATDRVEMESSTGDYFYHFGYLRAGAYRVAFTCSGEWDENGDDDYPSDPDGRFDFQKFSDPLTVTAGQIHRYDLVP
ncbi:MAG: DUF4382 domain-containing protein [Wenzhouxiangellaceae bacterium]